MCLWLWLSMAFGAPSAGWRVGRRLVCDCKVTKYCRNNCVPGGLICQIPAGCGVFCSWLWVACRHAGPARRSRCRREGACTTVCLLPDECHFLYLSNAFQTSCSTIIPHAGRLVSAWPCWPLPMAQVNLSANGAYLFCHLAAGWASAGVRLHHALHGLACRGCGFC